MEWYNPCIAGRKTNKDLNNRFLLSGIHSPACGIHHSIKCLSTIHVKDFDPCNNFQIHSSTRFVNPCKSDNGGRRTESRYS